MASGQYPPLPLPGHTLVRHIHEVQVQLGRAGPGAGASSLAW